MGYKALINKNVAKAFNLLKDLAEVVVLVKKTGVTFDFTSLTAVENNTAGIMTKAVITDSNKSAEGHNVLTKIMLFKTQDIGNITLYDKVEYGGITWSIGPIITSDNFITIATVQKAV